MDYLLQVLNLAFGPWEIFQLLVNTLRSVEKNTSNYGYSNSGAGDGFDQIESGPLPLGGSANSLPSSSGVSGGGGLRPKGKTVIEKQVGMIFRLLMNLTS